MQSVNGVLLISLRLSHLCRGYGHLMRHFQAFHSFIHEAKHKEVTIHSSSEDIFVIKAGLYVSDSSMMVVVHIKRPKIAEVFKVVRSV